MQPTTAVSTSTGNYDGPTMESDQLITPYIVLDGAQFPIQRETSILDQLRRDSKREPIRVKISFDSGRVLISESSDIGLPLYIPDGLPEKINTTCMEGDVRIGGFPICTRTVANKDEILFVHKKFGDFWYVPGGLVQPDDTSIWGAAQREAKEETGISIEEEGQPCFVYESVPGREPRRHNIMLFFNASYDGNEIPQTSDTTEILESKWISPIDFWNLYLENKIRSVPSIRLVFTHYINSQINRLGLTRDKLDLHRTGNGDDILEDLLALQRRKDLQLSFKGQGIYIP